jgi:hypothetical protein
MKRLIVATIGLSMGLAGVQGDALAQMNGAPTITGNVEGNCITSPSVNSPGANAGDWTISCGDIAPGPGLTVIGPPSVTSGPAAMPAPEPVAAPASEPAPVVAEPAPETTADTAPAETAVASATDADADNYADAAELEVGLDPANPDTDGDGVADGDEVTIYLTDPWVWDSDGDGLADGEELFATSTDPLVWDTNGNGVSDGEEVPV